ncbi:MAG: hypothetical protein VW441_03140 [Flavobacteriaceae bacterium]
MYSKYRILSLPYRLMALGIVVFLLFPSLLKVSHAYQYHTVQNECKHNTTHLHSSQSHNDALDYYFQVLADSEWFQYELKKPIFSSDIVENYKSFSYTTEVYRFTSRGPPFF